MPKFAQGKFVMQNPDKYLGTKTPTYRSSWEWAFMQFCDTNPAIQGWASEAVQIPYRNPLTGKQSVYVPDFLINYTDKRGKQHAELIEIKPKKETTMENAGRSRRAQMAVVVNTAKWEAAYAWCKKHRIKFRVVTEDEIFHQGKRK